MAQVGLTRFERGVAALAAIVLLLLQAAIPPGFMLARGSDTASHRPAIVLCTGHGALSLTADAPAQPGPSKHRPPSPGQTTPCPFAGHSGAALIPDPPKPQLLAYAAFAAVVVPAVRLEPGRGLAAPPPPPTGPPNRLI